MAKENSQAQRDPLVILASTDSSAFLLLYDIYYEKIFRYCADRLRSKQITEDMTSMIFIRAAGNIRRFGGKTRTEFSDWLLTIATDQVNSYLKEKQFADIINKLKPESIETIDSGHKEKLRAKILPAFNTAGAEKGQLLLYFAAAAVILIAAGILLSSKKSVQKPVSVVTPAPVKKINSPPPAPRLERTAQPVEKEETIEPDDFNAVEEKADESAKIKIGGIVKNQQSEPIEGAAVRVLVRFGENTNTSNISLLGTFKTDANGIWRCGSFPEDTYYVSIMATHPDYTQSENYQPENAEQLKNFSFEIILERSITVTGRVLDWEQRPLQATVTKGPFSEDRKNAVTCDANGWFRFNNVTAGVEVFTAQSAGAAPQVLPVEIKADMPPVIFNLKPADVINGRVVDVNGEPIKDASIAVSFWQGTSSVSFETKTDAGGFFEWQDAPQDEASFDIRKSGYMSVRNFAMKSGNDYTITLLPPFRISGSVTSSLPELPVETFKISIGYYDNANLSWQNANSSAISGNNYEIMISEPLDFQLKAEADDFEPAESPVFTPDQSAAKYDFVLEPLP
ncbi:MAG: carboxypeptidase regulatory-like domain-containing protein [Phycisphaerae bacterium]|jgi:hypothetical protein